jgi:SAM-dependent methyltransferase
VIERWSEGTALKNMPQDILLDLGAIVRRHPWWQARAQLTIRLLQELAIKPGACVLDAGCGWGVTLEALETAGYEATGLDQSRPALEQLDGPGRKLVEADLDCEFPEGTCLYDAVLALDVIEHLDQDCLAVRRLGTLLRPGGVLIVSVPALPDLFSEFDTVQGHRRRYLPGDLGAAFGDSGLQIERIFWWGRWLVPLLSRQRSSTRVRPGAAASEVYRRYLKLPPWPAVWLLKLLFRLEERPALRGQLKTGTSLFAVGRKATG